MYERDVDVRANVQSELLVFSRNRQLKPYYVLVELLECGRVALVKVLLHRFGTMTRWSIVDTDAHR